MNFAWMRAGFLYLRRCAHSRVRRKYGSWSIAHGMRQGMSALSPKICGNELENDGVAWIATKCHLPTLSLREGEVLQ